MQLEAIQARWADAIADVPYYTALVKEKRAPRDIREWSDLHCIPALTRAILQDRPNDFIRRSVAPRSFAMTAGSTGTPIRIGMDQKCRDFMRVVKLSAWMDFGYTPASRLFLIWGHAHLLGTGWKGRINNVKRKLADAFLGYRRVDAYCMNRASCEEYARELLRFRPMGIIGYASALDLFARYTCHLREEYRALGLRFVLATAEPLPHPDTSKLLEDLFGCPVVQEYGGAEFGQVAFKVGSLPFNVYSDLVHLEADSSTESPVNGAPALITTLYHRYVPLFRYCVGDAIIGAKRLPHGHVSQFDAVAGRLNDVITFEDGASVHSVAIFHCIHQERVVHSIQMVLNDDGVEIYLAGDALVGHDVIDRIKGRLAQVYAPLKHARFVLVEDLATNRAGKRRWFIDQRSRRPGVSSPVDARRDTAQ